MDFGKIKILYEDNHIIVVVKPVNILVQADITKDVDMLTLIKKYLKEKYNKPGNVYLGLVHRLDRPVGGVMVLAKTSKAAARLSEMIRNSSFKKTYLAVVCGNLKGNGEFVDNIVNDEFKVSIDASGKLSKLKYQVVASAQNLSLVKINLITGRKHQIRAQFAYHGYPLWGDQKYNDNASSGEQIALWAVNIKFKHPVRDEIMNFTSLPNLEKYPWSLFRNNVDNL
ncbi:MAG TPA: RNA pseudouridine synthase [Candidatus Onthocola stercorigallinarum]|nr:RNA pseudouridine synthase [Candidatus Onthocola stercorigallinarum]